MFQFLKKYKFQILLWFFILAYIVIFSYLSIARYLSFNSHYYDLGIMHQAVFNTSQGRFLEITNPETSSNISRIGIHFDPIMALLGPFYKIYSQEPVILLIAQTVIIALGALAIFLLSVKVLKNKILALLLSFLYLNFYQLQLANLFDFHAVMFLSAIILFIFYFIEVKKYIFLLPLIILSLLTKENVGLTFFFLGIYLFVIKKEKRLGLIISSVSLAVFFLVTFFVIPYFRQGEHFALKYYSNDLMTNFLRLFSWESLTYLFKLFEPVGLLPILSPILLLIATPELLINLLSSNPNMRIFYFHYTSLIIPFVFIASIYGLKKLIKIDKLRWLIVIVVVLNLYLGYLNGPLFHRSYQIDSEKLKTVRSWQQKLSDDQIKISSTPKLAPFFTARKYYYNFLYDPAFYDMGLTENDIIKSISKYEKADYVIIALDEVMKEDSLERKYYLHLKENPKLQNIFSDKYLEVYKKI